MTLLLASVLSPQITQAQTVAQEPAKKAFNLSGKATANSTLRMQDGLRVRDLIDRVMTFKDVRTKAKTLAALAGLLWESDNSYSIKVFHDAHNLLDYYSQANGETGLFIDEMENVRSSVISEVARRDINLAMRLADKANADIKRSRSDSCGNTYIKVGYNLIEYSPYKAVEFAEHGLSNGSWKDMIWFLRKLRIRDQDAANKLFLRTMWRVSRLPISDINKVLELGTYVFTSPSNTFPQESIQMVAVGKTLVVNISDNRPGAPPELVRAYLDTMIALLSNPVSDPGQKQLYYITGYQLLPKVKEWLPERLQELINSMQALITDIPGALLQEASYASLTRTTNWNNVGDSLREIESVNAADRRDALYVSLTFSLWYRGDFTQAYSVAQKVKDLTTRNQLSTLIDFGKAAKLIAADNLADAEVIARRLPAGLERAVLWLGIGRAYAAKEYGVQAAQAINAAIKDAHSVKDEHYPFLLLFAASSFTKFDSLRARQLFADAVRAFNQYEWESLNRVEWSQRVNTGGVWRDFPLTAKGVDYKTDRALHTLFKTGSGSMEILSELRHEGLLGAGYVALAESILK
jgi:hypothetical protein